MLQYFTLRVVYGRKLDLVSNSRGQKLKITYSIEFLTKADFDTSLFCYNLLSD